MVNRQIILKQIERGGLRIAIQGISMQPLYKSGNFVIVKSIKAPLEIGDIVFFSSNGKYVIHRICAIEGKYVITKGDNNRYVDQPVLMSDVLGLVEEDRKTSKIQKDEKPIIYINVWKNNLLNDYQDFSKLFNIKVLNEPGVIFKDGLNVCISRVSTKTLNQVNFNLDNEKVYFHIGADISNIGGYDLIKDDAFKQVIRIGPYSLEETMDSRSMALITVSNISAISH